MSYANLRPRPWVPRLGLCLMLCLALCAAAVRGPWGLENRQYWRPAVLIDEDASRIRDGHAPAIITIIRHLAVNLC